jgi:uncharacterized membrane protein YgcG
VTLAEIFRFKETGYDKNRRIIGVFQATGVVPSFIQKLADKGVHIPREIFSNEVVAQSPPQTGGASSSGSSSSGSSFSGNSAGSSAGSAPPSGSGPANRTQSPFPTMPGATPVKKSG